MTEILDRFVKFKHQTYIFKLNFIINVSVYVLLSGFSVYVNAGMSVPPHSYVEQRSIAVSLSTVGSLNGVHFVRFVGKHFTHWALQFPLLKVLLKGLLGTDAQISSKSYSWVTCPSKKDFFYENWKWTHILRWWI